MAKKLIFVKFLNDGSITGNLIKTEKVYDDETEMKKMFDECVGTFETYCKMFGQFATCFTIAAIFPIFRFRTKLSACILPSPFRYSLNSFSPHLVNVVLAITKNYLGHSISADLAAVVIS